MSKGRAETKWHKKLPELVNWSCEKSYIDIFSGSLTVFVDFVWMKLSISWDVSFCETCTLTKLFLLTPSTAEYLLLTDRALGFIPAGLVAKGLRTWQLMGAAFVKSDLGKKSRVTMALLTPYFDLKTKCLKGKYALL